MSLPTPTATRPPASALPLRAMRVVVASLAIGLLPTFLVGALSVPISDDLDVGTATIGAAVSAFFLAAALTSVPAGRLVDRRGAPFGYRTGLTGVGVAAGAVGLLAAAGWHLVVAFAFAGMSLAFVDPSIARTITGSVGWRRHGIAFGVKESAVPSASMLAGITLPLLGATVGWQVPFLVVAVLAVGLAALVPGNIEVVGSQGDSSRRSRGSSRASRDSSPASRGSSRASRRSSPASRGSSPVSRGSSPASRGSSRPSRRSSPARDGAATTRGSPGTTRDGSAAALDRPAATTDADITDRSVSATPPSDPAQPPGEGRSGDAIGADTQRSDPPALRPDRQEAEARAADDGSDERPAGNLALLAIGSGLAGGAGAAVATFIVPTGIVIGMGATAAGLVLSAASLGSIGVRLGAGWFVDRRPQAISDLLVGLLAAGFVGGVVLAVAAHLGATPVEVDALSGAVAVAGEAAPAAPGVVALLVIGAMLLLGPGWGWTGLVFLTATRLTPERPAQASGAILAGLGGGGALFPLGAGWLAESVGFGWTWTVVALAMALSVALMTIVRARR
ncbi:MAG: MFS transporter [Nitriliruptoraceae bacterium]